MTIDRIPISESENQYIEFKSENVKAMVLAEEIIAFANSEGGEIWLGIEDNGNVSGLSRSFEEDVMNICRTSCIPPIVPEYESLLHPGKRCSGYLRHQELYIMTSSSWIKPR